MCKARATSKTLNEISPGTGWEGRHDENATKTTRKGKLDMVHERARDATEKAIRKWPCQSPWTKSLVDLGRGGGDNRKRTSMTR